MKKTGKFEYLSKENGKQVIHYIIMQKHGKTLQYIVDKLRSADLELGVQVGIQVLNLLKKVHEAGYIYNDLKLDNIMVGSSDS